MFNGLKVLIMKKVLFFAAMALVAASCAEDKFIGDVANPQDNSPSESNAIVFASGSKGVTRADIYGKAAADLLGSHFYVTGTKGTEGTYNPTPTLVFDNYLVRYSDNSAGTTTSNTANWEYVGVVPATAPDANYVKLSDLNSQTIKFWDYSAAQYDFFGFSTGTYAASTTGSETSDPKTIGVTKMLYGEALSVDNSQSGWTQPIAYTFEIPSVTALENAFITDITEVPKSNYGKEVTLRFKNLGSKVRIALYETIPGYSVKDVMFYSVDNDAVKSGQTGYSAPTNKATLISADANGLPTNGSIDVYFPHVGTYYEKGATNAAQDYDIAAAIVTSPSTGATYVTYKEFGELTAQLKGNESLTTYEIRQTGEATNIFLGRTLPDATFAGDANASFYQTVFPVSDSDPLTLRVNYTLVPTDGAAETITVYGARAVVPSTYTKWLPNYAYTYIFKISDNTNGWTNTDQTKAGLFPITFDAVVAERTDATNEQKTITTVATPSITTYQQNHDISKNEYSKATGKDIFVQVWDQSASTPALASLTDANSLLYAITDPTTATTTEAEVMDALQKRTVAYNASATSITGRNSMTLEKKSIANDVNQIVNGPDDNPIGVTSGKAAKIDITSGSALGAGTYAYVYIYEAQTTDNQKWQPIALTSDGKVGVAVTGVTKNYPTLAKSALETSVVNGTAVYTTETTLGAGEAVDDAYIYFSVTKDGTGSRTYSFVSVDGKATVPAGLLKVAKTSITTNTSAGAAGDANANFYFDVYYLNNGKYAVKIIKIVS